MTSTRNQGERIDPREPMPADGVNADGMPTAGPALQLSEKGESGSGGNIPNPPEPAVEPESEGTSVGAALVATLKEIVQVVLPAVALAAFIHLFLAQATIVRGQSMQPNLRPNERLIMEKLSYYFQTPTYDEIVVLDLPASRALMIKRVVGLPGDTVELDDGLVYVNGTVVENPIILNDEPTSTDQDSFAAFGPVILDRDSYYVLGDNRENSNDSRVFGPVHRDDIKGRIWVRYWPLTRLTVFR